MIESKFCLTSETLEQLSAGELAPASIREIETHVDDCERCRQMLTAVESDSQWQEEIFPVLRMREDLNFQRAESSDAEYESQTLASVLRLLGPSDDPHMLGRIGSYEIVSVIGRGGMGVVFKAFDGALNRFVAIKMLLPHLAASGAARKRFAREGRAAAAVIDDNVMPIYKVDQWQGNPYLVTQYSRGMTLQQRIRDQGPLEVNEILRIAMQTANGLDAAHAQGLVHRDIKPSNILLDGSVERAMLTDFGLARAVDDASITRTGTITGTPQYMSPEQACGESVDARSDLFSLGCVMYAMCTGRPPFRADNSYAILRLIADKEPRPIQEINSDIPSWLSTIISRLMSKRPEDRYADAAEVAELCEVCLAHVQQPAAVALPDALARSVSDRGGSSSWRKWLAIASIVFLLVFAGSLFAIELNKGKLVIECASDNVPIRIMQGDVEVEKLTVSKDGATIKIAAGKYLVEVDGDSDNVIIEGNSVSLGRGEVELVKIRLEEDTLTPQNNALVDNLRKFDEEYSKRYDKEFAEYKRLWRSKIDGSLMVGRGASQSHVLLKEVTEKLGETKEMLKAATSDRDRILVATESGSGGIQQLVWQFRKEEKMPEIPPESGNGEVISALQLRIGAAEDAYRIRKARLGDGHPSVKLSKEQLDRLMASLDKILDSPAEKANDFRRSLTDAEALDSYEKLVDAKIKSLEKEFGALLTQQTFHAKRTKELNKVDQEIAVQGDKVETLKEMLTQITKRFAELATSQGHERKQEVHDLILVEEKEAK